MNLLILRLTLQRVALALVSLLVVSAMVFAITAVLPGDAAQAQLGQEATPETLAALRQQMGLDVPAPVRYWRWLSGAASGKPGDSIVTHTPVADMLASRLPNSLLLAAITVVVAVPLALVLGIAAAMYRGSVFDRVVSGGRGRGGVGARVPGRHARGAGVRGRAALAAGAVVQRESSTRR